MQAAEQTGKQQNRHAGSAGQANRQAAKQQQKQANEDILATPPRLEVVEINPQAFWQAVDQAKSQIGLQPDEQPDEQPSEQAAKQTEKKEAWIWKLLAEHGYWALIQAGWTPEQAAEQAGRRALKQRQQEWDETAGQADKQAEWWAKWKMSWQPGTQPLQLQADQANLAGKIKQQNCQVAAMGISARIATPRPAAPRAAMLRPIEMLRIERPRTIFVCFFCKAKGHKKSRCLYMKCLLNAGEIHLDWKCRI